MVNHEGGDAAPEALSGYVIQAGVDAGVDAAEPGFLGCVGERLEGALDARQSR